MNRRFVIQLLLSVALFSTAGFSQQTELYVPVGTQADQNAVYELAGLSRAARQQIQIGEQSRHAGIVTVGLLGLQRQTFGQ